MYISIKLYTKLKVFYRVNDFIQKHELTKVKTIYSHLSTVFNDLINTNLK